MKISHRKGLKNEKLFRNMTSKEFSLKGESRTCVVYSSCFNSSISSIRRLTSTLKVPLLTPLSCLFLSTKIKFSVCKNQSPFYYTPLHFCKIRFSCDSIQFFLFTGYQMPFSGENAIAFYLVFNWATVSIQSEAVWESNNISSSFIK